MNILYVFEVMHSMQLLYDGPEPPPPDPELEPTVAIDTNLYLLACIGIIFCFFYFKKQHYKNNKP